MRNWENRQKVTLNLLITGLLVRFQRGAFLRIGHVANSEGFMSQARPLLGHFSATFASLAIEKEAFDGIGDYLP